MATTDTLVEGDQRERDAASTGTAATDPGTAPEGTDTARAALRGRVRGDVTDDGWRWKVAAGLGTLSLLGAVAVVVLPGTLVQPVRFTTATVEALRSFALLLGAFVGAFGLYVVYHRDPPDDTDDGSGGPVLAAMRPEHPHGPTNDAVGTQLDDYLDEIGGMVEPGYDDLYTSYRVRKNLESLAVDVVADAADCPRERAREHVAAGTWTDDVRAAAFVGGPDAPDRPLAMRIPDWANGATYDRQVRATVDELAAINGGERP